MNFDILGNWKGGAIKDAGDEAIRLHGSQALNNIDIGTLEGLYGANVEDVKNYIKSKQQQALNNNPQIQAAAVKAGLKPFEQSGGFANYGEGLSGVMSRINVAQETKDKKAKAETLAIKKGIREEGYAESAKTLAATLKAQQQNNAATLAQQSAQHTATLTSQQNQFAHTDKQNRLDRRHQTELADSKEGLQMQMAIMQNDLAEKRMDYDRETQRMDKRSAAIAQLMSGLGSLGGAFSL